MWTNGSWGFFPWMWIFPVLFLIICVLFLSRMMGGWSMWGDRKSPESAREILDRRYARGEISREVYAQMKKDLE